MFLVICVAATAAAEDSWQYTYEAPGYEVAGAWLDALQSQGWADRGDVERAWSALESTSPAAPLTLTIPISGEATRRGRTFALQGEVALRSAGIASAEMALALDGLSKRERAAIEAQLLELGGSIPSAPGLSEGRWSEFSERLRDPDYCVRDALALSAGPLEAETLRRALLALDGAPSECVGSIIGWLSDDGEDGSVASEAWLLAAYDAATGDDERAEIVTWSLKHQSPTEALRGLARRSDADRRIRIMEEAAVAVDRVAADAAAAELAALRRASLLVDAPAGWTLELVEADDGARDASFWREADAPLEGSDGEATSPRLGLHCASGAIGLEVEVGLPLEPSTSTAGAIELSLQVGAGIPRELRAPMSDDGAGFDLPGGATMAEALVGQDSLVLRFSPMGGAQQTATFSLEGVDHAVDGVHQACGLPLPTER